MAGLLAYPLYFSGTSRRPNPKLSIQTPDGHIRTFHVYQGLAAADVREKPLLVVLHGGHMHGRMFQEQVCEFGFEEAVSETEDGWLVVYPDGWHDEETTFGYWNNGMGDPDIPAQRENIDDVTFLTQMITFIDQKISKVDTHRIFFTGASNGAFMCYRLVRDMKTYPIAGIAPVIGSLPEALMNDEYVPAVPALPVCTIMGDLDPMVPFEGGGMGSGPGAGNPVWSARDTVDFWLHFNGLTHEPQVTEIDNVHAQSPYPEIENTIWQEEVYTSYPWRNLSMQFHRVRNGGHRWPTRIPQHPNENQSGPLGAESREFSACAVIFDFFKEIQFAVAEDLNRDGRVDSLDLARLMGTWGPAQGHPADLTGDGRVNSQDLAQLLGAWG